MRIPLASSGLRAVDIAKINEVLESGNLTMGKEVKNFEAKMCDYLGVSNFIMVNSGSSANLLIFEALLRPSKKKPRIAFVFAIPTLLPTSVEVAFTGTVTEQEARNPSTRVLKIIFFI